MSITLPQDSSESNSTPLIDCPADVGVLLVGHGTRNSQGQRQFRNLYEQFSQLIGPIPSQMAFLELTTPDIQTSLEMLAEQGVRRLLTVPAILFTAGHALSDIPEAVAMGSEKMGISTIGQTETLDCSPELLELSAVRFRQELCPAKCHSVCAGDHCGSCAWLLVGRGSSSPSATERSREFMRLRWKLTPTAIAEVAFIHGQEPTVDQAMDQMAKCGLKAVVVQPHLLFSGKLFDQLTDQVARRQNQNPHQRWMLTNVLGADRQLAKLLADRTINSLIRMLALPVSTHG